MTVLEVVLCLVIMIAMICIHEGIHYGMATILGYKPIFTFGKFLTPTVEFENKNRVIDNLLISISAPLTLFLVGCLINGETSVVLFLKYICLLNIFCLLPLSADGQVMILSLINLVKGKEYEKNN